MRPFDMGQIQNNFYFIKLYFVKLKTFGEKRILDLILLNLILYKQLKTKILNFHQFLHFRIHH